MLILRSFELLVIARMSIGSLHMMRWVILTRKRLFSSFIAGGIFIAVGFIMYSGNIDFVGIARFKSQDGDTQKSKSALVSTNSGFFNMTQIHLDHTARLQHMRKQCQEQDGNTSGLFNDIYAYSRIEIDRENNYLYCPNLKSGSTFFRRMLLGLRKYHSVKNPYTIPISDALDADRNFLKDILPLTLSSTVAFLHNTTAFLFVRDPFTRLLSGYVDKFLAPNPVFWSDFGGHIISNFRPMKTDKSRTCGHNVTFEEFIRYVVNGEVTNSSYRDPHFTPSYDNCKVCKLNYTILGKMETFERDFAYTLFQLGHHVAKEELSSWARNSTFDTIMDSILIPFTYEAEVKKCMTWHEALVRVWRKLQIRGIILFEHRFPWSPEYTVNFVTINIFTDMVMKLHLNTTKEQMHKQKLDVLAEAYSNIPASDLQKLVNVFYLDFQLFQYNPYPNYIFDVNVAKTFHNKNWIFNVSAV